MYSHLQQSKSILLSGCGGGYDVFCGLDLYFNLISQAKKVVFGNYSFTNINLLKEVGEMVSPCCYKIDSNTLFDEAEYIKDLIKIVIPPNYVLEQMNYTKDEYIAMHANLNKFQDADGNATCYFPEYKLISTLKEKYNLDATIYCFAFNSDGMQGIKDLTEAYNKIIELENIDTVVLVDGGTDALMTGCEKDDKGKPLLGTPFEDVSSIVAVYNSSCDRNRQFLYSLGYNVDRYHDVTDENFLKNTANQIKNDCFVGSYMLNKRNESAQKYIDTFMNCNPENSIVNSHIVMSLQGNFGNVRCEWLHHRIGGSDQYIHPLMSLYWIYELKGVYEYLMYDVEKLKETRSEYEISQLLHL